VRTTIVQTWLSEFAFAVCIVLYLFHLCVISAYAVDIPYMDEWASFTPNQLPDGLSLADLFAQHNEHRIVTTKLLVWLQFHLNGWNLKTHQILNFAIYGFILITIGWFAKETVPEVPGWWIFGFLIFLLSPINWANHFWGIQSSVYFWLFFYLIAAFFLFSETQRWRDLILGGVAASLSTYSMASGFVSSLVLVVMYGLFKFIRIHSSRESRNAQSFAQLIVVVGFLGTTTLLWLVGYRKPAHTPSVALPYEWRFWGHFVNLVALGFGADRVSSILGTICVFIVVIPVSATIIINNRNFSARQWRAFVSTLAVLAVLASLAAGRAGFGVEQAKQSRYFEFAMSLIPLSVVNWALLLQRRQRLKAAVLASLWIFCLLTFWNSWKDFQNYKLESVRRNDGLKCLSAYYQRNAGNNCPTIYPEPIPTPFLEAAKTLNVSFYRKFTRHREG
jgi:hypothetical protein